MLFCICLVQLNKSDFVGGTTRTLQRTATSSLNQSLDTTQGHQTRSATSTKQTRLKKPIIKIQPKTKWRIQYPKDLIRNPAGRKSAALLQGVGRQRSRIKVMVNYFCIKNFETEKINHFYRYL